MKRLWHMLRRTLGSGPQRGLLESRINRVTLTAQGLIRKQAGPVFARGNHRYYPRLLIQREAAFLARLGGRHTPRLIAAGDDWLEMEHCGAELNAGNIPTDWREQVAAISAALAEGGIVHRDIKQGNVLVKDGHLYLIDFGWAICEAETPYVTPRELCADVPHEHIYDNRIALEWLLSSYANSKT
jgi:hypothetical protein